MGKLAGITSTARKMVARGWTVESIARLYGVAVADVLAILPRRLPPPPRPAPQPKPVDPWRGTWHQRDDAGVEAPVVAEIPAVQVVDQAGAAEIPATLEARTLEPWNGPASPYASEPRKITPAVLAAARKLHQQGRTWPAIAAELGCTRNALFYARKRELER